MKVTRIVNNHVILRLIFVITGSIFLCVMMLLVFYSLFLIFPSLFIKAGLVALFPLRIIFFISLIIPLSIFTYRVPFFGDGFFRGIIISPYSPADLVSALELERNKSFPGRDAKDPGSGNNITAFLSDRFNERILEHIKPESEILKEFLPGLKPTALFVIIALISAVLTYANWDMVADVYTALRTGLPAELVALDSPVKFEKLEATVIPPAYIDSGPAKITDLTVNKKIKVMQGSSILIKGSLKSISSIQSGRLILATDKGVEYFTASINDSRSFEAAFLAPMKGAFALEFTFSEIIKGRASGKSKIYMIEAMPDQPPSIQIFFPPVDYSVLFGNPVEISFAAADDYGILEISLYHRNPELDKEYFREIIARFPKEPKTDYASTYEWNPVLREGEKIDELVYDPGTKTVEYFLEVKDINVFSGGGTARSETRYVHFTDMFGGFNEGMNLIQELIDGGKKLLSSSWNRGTADDYRKKLSNAVEVFNKELKETFPQSSLIERTYGMINIMHLGNIQGKKEYLKNYIAYLERFLVFVNLLLETEAAKSIDNELAKADGINGDMTSQLKRITPIAEMLEKEFKNDIEEIKSLMEKGDHEEARAKTSELLEKIKKRLSEEHEKSTAVAKGIAAEIKAKLENMSKQAADLLKDQEANKAMTDKGKIKGAALKQEDINKGLSDLQNRTGELSSEYPFIMSSLNAYAGAAKAYGERALSSLEKSEPVRSSQYQKQVIQYLKAFMESSSRQMELMEELSKGNFEQLMSRGFANRFVLIPKEAVYTIPIEYKNKIIEMSKDRSKSTPGKEAFWRDILE